MSLVWRKLQRSNKKAAKFQFTADLQELSLLCDEKWQPRQVGMPYPVNYKVLTGMLCTFVMCHK
jgi:hypothetical protein